MKSFFLIALATLSFSALADHHKGHHGKDMDKWMDNMSFEEAKKMKSEKLAKKSELIGQAR